MTSTITSTGLGSGLDIKTMVAGLVSAEQSPTTTKLDKQQATINTQISAYGNLKSAMSTLQSSLSSLENPSTFQKLSATSSDTSTVTASAFSNADPGSYKLEVKQLATSQTLASPAFSSVTSTVGTGTLTIQFGTTTFDTNGKPTNFTQDGSQAALTLNIDSSNNTLTGLSDAINKANAGVTAVIVTDNSGSRLVLNSTQTGAKSSMQISVADADSNNTDTSGLSALAFNTSASNMTQPVSAQDAKLAINGLDIVSSSNTVNTAIKGLSLNLQQAQPGKTVTVSVSQNNDDITTAINSFITNYNALIAVVNPLTSYDATTQTAGTLQSDLTLNTAMWKLRSTLGGMVGNQTSSVQSLADIGITTQADGTLALNSSKLSSQLTSNRLGVAGLFANLGTSTDTNVSFLSSNSNTKAGKYAINITQSATQGVLNGAAPTSLTVSAGSDTFAINVDGIQSGTISLSQKTYASYDDLATEIQSSINGDNALKASGVTVGVAYDGTKLVFTSKSYGSTSQIAITANTTTSLGLNVGSGIAGKNVSGTINGQAATGNGQTLTSTAGDSQGLSALINDNVIGDKGTVSFTNGIMGQLDNIMSGILNSTTGSFTIRTNSLQKGLTDIATQRTDLATRMTKYENDLLTRFNAMDTLVGKMKDTSNYLTQQFSSTSSNN